jgi:hypothetical protein
LLCLGFGSEFAEVIPASITVLWNRKKLCQFFFRVVECVNIAATIAPVSRKKISDSAPDFFFHFFTLILVCTCTFWLIAQSNNFCAVQPLRSSIFKILSFTRTLFTVFLFIVSPFFSFRAKL